MRYFPKVSRRIIKTSASALVVIAIIYVGINYFWETKITLLRESKSGSPYGTVIFNSSGIKNKEYPLRHFISHKSIERVKFLDPKMLKDHTETIIVVLGDRPLDRTTPTVNMVYRVLKGMELSRKFPSSILIMSGGTTAGEISEAQMMGLIAWSRGLNPRRIILEDRSRNTLGNAEFSAKIIKSKNIGQEFVITDQLRIERTTQIFQSYVKEFKNVRGVECNVPVKEMMEQMEQYLKINNNRIVDKRLHQLKSIAKDLEDVDYENLDRVTKYGKIISNSSGMLNREFPMRNPISDSVIEKAEFLGPQQLKNNINTAIFVLPNRPLDEVTPSIDSVYRALKAVELSRKYPDAVLIMLGPKTAGDIPEAQMMALIAWSRGISPSKIIVEDKARSIEDKAEFIAKTIESQNIVQTFIISKQEHLERIMPVLKKRAESRDIKGVDCGITKDLVIGQMEQYLKTNDDKVIHERIDNLKKGKIGID